MKSLVEYLNESSVNDRLLNDIEDILSASDFAKCEQMNVRELIYNISRIIDDLDERANMRMLDKVLNKYNKYTVYELTDDMVDELSGGDPEDLLNFDDEAIIETDHVSVCVHDGAAAAIVGLQLWTDSDYEFTYWVIK